jgi:asparagine synthase (glutamine-hydrolysing)
MCGIAGILATNQQLVRRALPAMSACQRHRGPDSEGEAYLPLGDRHLLGLGHRRLAIIDLSPAGHQPMVHPITGDQIIFNGEIYNFQVLRDELLAAGETFRGTGDTEVMLHALARWGPEAVARFQGMFAFAYYGNRNRRLLVARDSVGIKPLYVAKADGVPLMFASEVRSILASGLVSRRLDPRGVAGLLAYGAVQQPLTIFRDVSSFPAGCYQIWEADGTTRGPVRFWDYPTSTRPDISEADAIDQLRAKLDAAVRDHLVADVPVGLFLSSGLDSTILAGLAARHTPHLNSFTVGFADQPDMSEQGLASETAKLFGLSHTNIDLTGKDAEDAAGRWLRSLDQPSVDGLNVFVISQAVRRAGMTVALSGQGGDELFCGYPSFRDVPRLRRLMRQVGWLPRAMRGLLGKVAAANRSHAVREKLVDMLQGDGSVLSLALQRRRAMSDSQIAALGLDAAELGLAPSFQPPEALATMASLDGLDDVAAVSQVESRFYQGNMLLRDGDANGMAHSLEIRVPLLDQRILDLAYSLPGRLRLPPRSAGKHLLRTAFAAMLRPALAEQKKRGFTLPIRRWMLGPLRERCESALAKLKATGVLRPAGVDAVWSAFLRDPESPIWSRAFTLVVLGSYVQETGATL